MGQFKEKSQHQTSPFPKKMCVFQCLFRVGHFPRPRGRRPPGGHQFEVPPANFKAHAGVHPGRPLRACICGSLRVLGSSVPEQVRHVDHGARVRYRRLSTPSVWFTQALCKFARGPPQVVCRFYPPRGPLPPHPLLPGTPRPNLAPARTR